MKCRMPSFNAERMFAAVLVLGCVLVAAPAWPQCNPGPFFMDPEWGDAPEGAQAYPDLGVPGLFPTCLGGPAECIQHAQIPGGPANNAFFGPNLDYEPNGNGGICPPPFYENDECSRFDGDAGLVMPTPFTFTPQGPPQAITCSGLPPTSLAFTCTRARWGRDIDITLSNFLFAAGPFPSPQVVYLNVLMDFDRDGMWSPYPVGPFCGVQVPEHVVRNVPVPIGFSGLVSQLPMADFDVGPDSGYVWVRFTLTPTPVLFPWDGSGFYEGGETEDYMLHIAGGTPPAEFGDAPMGVPAYPPYLVQGQFPTCTQTGSYVTHPANGALFFGPGLDYEQDGNADDCAFNVYDNDECFGGEAGIVVPRPYTIEHTLPGLAIVPCTAPATDLGIECTPIAWGPGLDMRIVNGLPMTVYFNMLADWDQDGDWTSPPFFCSGLVREHVVRNLPVPAGFNGLLSSLNPGPRFIGRAGFVWTRFTVSTAQAPNAWDGGGNMGEGETEDYLLHVGASATDAGELRLGALRAGDPSPNPTFGGTQVALDLPAGGDVTVEVYDAKGRAVRRAGMRTLSRGTHQLAWDGLDAAGKRPAAGMYFMRVTVGSEILTRRVLLLN